MNVPEILRARAAAHPDRIALADAATHRTLTYAELDAASARVAAALRARGMRPGETVLVLHPVAPELYAVLIGMLRSGLVPAIPPPGANRAALARCARKHPPHAVLVGGIGWIALGLVPELRHAARLSTTATPFAYDVLHAAATASGDRTASGAVEPRDDGEVEPRDDGDAAILTFTSGSTGESKALIRSHGVARAQVEALGAALALDDGTSLCTMPMVLLAELAAGATCVLPGADLRRPGRVDGDTLAERMRTHGVTRIVASPALLANLAAALRARGETLPALRLIASGGAPVMPPLAGALRTAAPNARILAVYGSTEAEPIALLDTADVMPVDHAAMRAGAGVLAGIPCTPATAPAIAATIPCAAAAAANATFASETPASVQPAGVAVVATQRGAVYGPFAQKDAVERHALSANAVGEIVVTGPHVVPYYLDSTDDAATKIRAGERIWHRTGDLGYLDDHGRLWLVGRASGAIEDAHGTMEPLRVECALAYVPGIARSALAAADGARVLVVEPLPNARIDEHAIRAAVAFAHVDRVIVANVPVDARHNAKVDYAALHRLVRRCAHAA